MEVIPIIGEVVIFFLLVYTYAKLCTHREISKIGKVAEVLSLYVVSVWSILGNLKFYVWVLMIATIGTIKILITKKKKIERRNKGLVN